MKPTSATPLQRLLEELEESRIRLGLEGVRALLAALGSPQDRVPHALVAGTNGKGSTAAFLNSILVAAGYRTGLYSSPHLESVRERIRLDGRAISGSELERRLRRVIALAEQVNGEWPTYFEGLTAVAFDGFAEMAEIAVMEVGMGGRLDATNTGQPIVSVVTEIGLDHVGMLGVTEEAIALEKAGVMREGRPVLARVSSKPALGVLETRAREVGARWHDVGSEVELSHLRAGVTSVTTPADHYEVRSPLAGEHQAGNLALAIRTAEVLAAEGWSQISPAAIVTGIETCRWPGRLECVDLPACRVFLDAAHNPQGAAALAAFLAAQGRPHELVFGALGDKDLGSVLPVLAKEAQRVVLTAPASTRAVPPADLVAFVGASEVVCREDAASALDEALAGASETVVVCGSIYLVGEVRQLLRERFGEPMPAASVNVSPARAASQSG